MDHSGTRDLTNARGLAAVLLAMCLDASYPVPFALVPSPPFSGRSRNFALLIIFPFHIAYLFGNTRVPPYTHSRKNSPTGEATRMH